MGNFRKPDLSAPRYRVKRKNLITDEYMDDFYKRYPELSKYKKAEIKEIVKGFNELLWQEIIETRDGVELPEGLGYVFIGACPYVKKDNIDYGKSIKYGMAVTHKNYDTDGYLGKIFYSNYSAKYKLRDRSIWAFNGGRYFKRAVTKSFKEDWRKYLVIDNTTKVSKMYKKMRQKDYFDTIREKQFNEYNEFDID
jgi:hypothetical protein